MTQFNHPGSHPEDDFVPTEELVRRQGAQPIKSLDELAAAEDPFGSDAEYDDFLAFLYASRRAETARALSSSTPTSHPRSFAAAAPATSPPTSQTTSSPPPS